MLNLVKQKMEHLREWLHKTIRHDYHSEVEAYLQQSVDAADLEQRIRNLRDRGHAI